MLPTSSARRWTQLCNNKDDNGEMRGELISALEPSNELITMLGWHPLTLARPLQKLCHV